MPRTDRRGPIQEEIEVAARDPISSAAEPPAPIEDSAGSEQPAVAEQPARSGRGKRWLVGLTLLAMAVGSAALAAVGVDGFAEASDASLAADVALEDTEAAQARTQQFEGERVAVEADIADLEARRTLAEQQAQAATAAHADATTSIAAALERMAVMDAAIGDLHAAITDAVRSDGQIAGVFSAAVERGNQRDVDGMHQHFDDFAPAAIQSFADSTDALREAVASALASLERLGLPGGSTGGET